MVSSISTATGQQCARVEWRDTGLNCGSGRLGPRSAWATHGRTRPTPFPCSVPHASVHGDVATRTCRATQQGHRVLAGCATAKTSLLFSPMQARRGSGLRVPRWAQHGQSASCSLHPPPPITTATTTTTPTHPSAPTSAAAPEAHLCSALPSRPDRREPSPHVDGGPHLDRCLPHPNSGWLSFSSSAPFRLRARPIEGALVRVRAPFYELGPDGTAKP